MPAVTRRALGRYYRHGPLARRILTSPDHNVLYVKNPKAGCSTILLWLHRMHTGDHAFVPELTIHKEHRLPAPGVVGWDRVMDMLNGSAYRFTFVRHPLRRFESAYLDKMSRGPWPGRVRTLLALPDDAEVTFELFLEAVESQDPLTEMDLHWRPQHLNLMHPVVEYDRIGRLETFDADLERIREEAALPDVPVQVRNATQGDRSSVYDGRPDLVRRVEAIYATDFEVYGY